MSPNSVTAKPVFVVSVFLLLLGVIWAAAENQPEEDELQQGLDKYYVQDGKKFALWFGPRLGRKKKNYEDENRATEELQAVMKLVKERPWVVVAVNNGKPEKIQRGIQLVDYIPRRGRESGEERDLSFSPRLGRQFSPRLGRENNAIEK